MNPLAQFALAGRAAAEAAKEIAWFSTTLQGLNCEEYFQRMLDVARARSEASSRSVGSFLSDISGAIASGEHPGEVLRRIRAEGSA